MPFASIVIHWWGKYVIVFSGIQGIIMNKIFTSPIALSLPKVLIPSEGRMKFKVTAHNWRYGKLWFRLGTAHSHLKHSLPSVLQSYRTDRPVRSDDKASKKIHASQTTINKGWWGLERRGPALKRVVDKAARTTCWWWDPSRWKTCSSEVKKEAFQVDCNMTGCDSQRLGQRSRERRDGMGTPCG